jgi:hypothetical protein
MFLKPTLSLADTFIFLGIVAIIAIIFSIIDYRKSSVEYKKKENFRDTAIKVLVQLNEVKITTQGFTETTKEIKSNHWNRSEILYNSMTGNDHKNFITTKHCYNTLSYNFKHDGKNYKQTFIIEMDVYNLKIWFEVQKETYLYIGTGEFANNLYLDLEFMNR